MQNSKKIIRYTLGTLVLVSFLILAFFYSKIHRANVAKDGALYLPSNASFDTLLVKCAPFLKNPADFAWVAKQKKYTQKIKGGKYVLKKGTSSNELVNLLRSGRQTPVQVTFNNQHRLESLAGKIAKQIEADSLSLVAAFKDSLFLSTHGFDLENALGMYVPNTYEFLWNSSASDFQNRMLREYKTFWNAQRREKAKNRNLKISEVIALASIVQKETAKIDERPVVAGLYLNRLQKKWALQADPTVIFALRQKNGSNFKIQRVLDKDLKIDSPYNTYKYPGVPPGPICMPDITSIEAVLNPSEHGYMFMCASTEKIGRHVFSKNLRQHLRNAKKYQNWLSNQRVMR